MPIYFVTGKLGSGKSIASVARIKEKLDKGLPVATNLNIDLKEMLGRNKKNTRLYRVPDKPEARDLEALGVGNKSYDEDLNGLLVLDECGTWFNSRTWADKGRQAVINWLLHARKLGWDVIFIIQDLSLVDKQARLSLAEHVVYCRRTDRINIPFIGSIYKIFTGSKLPFPKVHLAIVRYGDSPTSIKVDTWTTIGTSLYSCYDTKQQFSDYYNKGLYSVLPPYYTHGRYSVPMSFKNVMRITKIYLKKYSRLTALSFGSIATFIIMTLNTEPSQVSVEDKKTKYSQIPINQVFNDWAITDYSNLPNQLSSYGFIDSEGVRISSTSLRNKGYEIKSRGSCEALIIKEDQHVSIYCN